MAINVPPMEWNEEGDRFGREHLETGQDDLGHGSSCNYCLDSMVPGMEKNFAASGSRLTNFHTARLNHKLNKIYGKEI
jgi:hypothetical protein